MNYIQMLDQEHVAQLKRPKIVCLCGSGRFWDDFTDQAYKRTVCGEIVLMPHVCKTAHSTSCMREYEKELDELHLRKIDMCDYVLVVNHDGYVGKSTKAEIDYAIAHKKEVRWVWPDLGKAWLEARARGLPL